jgi:hypothetical protein
VGGSGTGGSGGAASLGICRDKRENSTACERDEQCESAECVDFVCCDDSCEGDCQYCKVDGLEGTCTIIGSDTVRAQPVEDGGTVERNACDGDADSGCRGFCDGSSATQCTYPGNEAERGDPSCTCPNADCATGPATETHFVCDGAGAFTEDPRPCAGYRCDDDKVCKTSCASDEDCIRDFICESESCQALTGPTCRGEHIVLVPNSDSIDCTPYDCAGSACLTSCQSVDDCVAPAACNAEGQCVTQVDPVEVTSCSCRLVGAKHSSPGSPWRGRAPWLLAGLALGATALRRRRQ